ncbi:hypothetical protein SNEBB_011073 [Seison nebaliae]|nr:hypothetical protein SNEBB_011073 [Seison nebaliae]
MLVKKILGRIDRFVIRNRIQIVLGISCFCSIALLQPLYIQELKYYLNMDSKIQPVESKNYMEYMEKKLEKTKKV